MQSSRCELGSDCTSTVFVHILVCTCISKNTFMYILVCILKYLVYTIINYQNKTLYFQLIFHVLSCKSNTIKNQQKKVNNCMITS